MDFSRDDEELVEELLRQEWVSPNELGYLMAVSNGTARDWCQNGLVPALRIGGSWRVAQRDLLHFIRSNQELYGQED
jgi:hypothetical protein